MPSPFVKSGATNTSRDEMTDRKPIPPVPESYEGDNLPYRGVMYHGVEPTHQPEPTAPYDTTAVTVFEDPIPQQDPVPVRVVNRADRFQRTARADAFTLTATDTPREVAGREDTRIGLTIINTHDADTVYVGFTPNMVAWNGSYPLLPGKEIKLVSKEPVWVMGTVDTVVGWLAEYELPVDDD